MGFAIIVFIALIAGVIESKILMKDTSKKEKAGLFLSTVVTIVGPSCFIVRIPSIVGHFLNTEPYNARQYITLISITVAISVVVCLFFAFIEKNKKPDDKETKQKKPLTAIRVISFVVFSISTCLLAGAFFVNIEWSQTKPEQLVVNMLSPTVGTEIGIYLHGFEYALIALCCCGIFAVFCFRNMSICIGAKNLLTRTSKSIIAAVVAVAMLGAAGAFAEKNLHISMIYTAYFIKSDFLEKNYTDPKTTKIEFPKQKRNLIFIYLESIENTYLDKSLGGYMDENLMPELTELSHEGLIFSNTDREFGGPVEAPGTSWSLASMVNQTLGIPMKAPTSMASYATENHFIAGAVGLGDILKEQGYNQTIMIGSDARFGGLNYLYQTHGDYRIFDYEYAKAKGYIPEDYKVWWGFEDSKLYGFAKEEITRLYKEGKPFNFTMENANTHMPDGYLPPGAPQPYKSPYANAINYSQKEVVEFVKWIQAQPFYKNTTVILIGDHRSMDSKFFKDFDSDYIRTQYNLILNPAPAVTDTQEERFVNRQYANFDMFPTTLAAMGCKIEGNKLGVGTNLFSEEKTLIEEYGMDKVSSEFMKKSPFYSKTLCEE